MASSMTKLAPQLVTLSPPPAPKDAQDAIFGLESVFSETTDAPAADAADDDLPLAPAPVTEVES